MPKAKRLFLGLLATLAYAQTAHHGLLLISIDGLRPDYVSAADQHGLKIPNLREVAKTGATTCGVRGVLPTVTYPSHTTLMTGVWPSKHGIANNVAFDPTLQNQEGWNWYFEDIHSPTLWEAASKAGYIVGSVSWPVTVGARYINYLIPEFWRASTPDDLKLIRAVSTPGFIAEMEPKIGPYRGDMSDVIPTDWARTRYAEAMIRSKHARFVTVHLAALDHMQHESGPFSPDANATLEQTDQMVGVLMKVMHDEDPASVIAVVSDHGFARIDHRVHLKVAFVKAGLITPNKNRGISSWKADAWAASASFLIVLKDPGDSVTRDAVQKLLTALAADPANGIERVLDRKQIAEMGGSSMADFFVDLKPGFAAGGALEGPLVREIQPGGTHGYAPTHPEMLASFLISGSGIAKGKALGEIDMRSIAPTLARVLGVPFPTADLKPLDIFVRQ